MRFIAALMVALFHYTAASPAWGISSGRQFPHVHAATTYGALGVELFFLISGFVICMSSWGRSVGDFFVSRATRLYPAYWLAVPVTFAVLRIWPVKGQHVSVVDMLTNLTMLQGATNQPNIDPVYWTLWFELQFYVLFAIFVVWRGVTYPRVLRFCIGWLAVSAITHGLPAAGGQGLNLAAIFDTQYSSFFVGGITVYLMYRFRPTPLLWCLLGYCYLTGLWIGAQHVIGNKPFVGWQSPSWPMIVLITAFFLALLACTLGPLARVRAGWLTTVGALTYPFYLVHEEIGQTIITALRRDIPAWPLVIGVVAAMVLFAYLINRVVEDRFAPLLRRMLRQALAELRSHDLPRAAAVVRAAAAASGVRGSGHGAPEPGPVAADIPSGQPAPVGGGLPDPRPAVADVPSGSRPRAVPLPDSLSASSATVLVARSVRRNAGHDDGVPLR